MAAGLVLAGEAAACTCPAAQPVGERLRSADAAFVGRLVSATGGRFTYTVDQQVKGQIGETVVVRSAVGEAQCGLRRTPEDEAVGVLLTRAGAGWVSSLCAQTEAGELLDVKFDRRGNRVKLAIGFVILGLVLAHSIRRLRRRGRELEA